MIYLFFVIYLVYRITLSLLQINFVKEALGKKALVLSEEAYKKAGELAIYNEKFSIFSSLYSFVLVLFWLTFGLSFLQVFPNSLLGNTALVMTFLLINSILELPLELYSKFVKDKIFGFSNLTFKLYFIDKMKTLALFLLFGTFVIFVLIFCINFLGETWWLWAFSFSFLIILLINFLYPTFLAPLFNKMTLMEDGELKQKIDELLSENSFQTCPIFISDASKRDKRLNAYFGGFGKFKRVVLFDTLLEKLEKEEILAVLAHELGHFSHKDIFKNIFLIGILLFSFFAFFGTLNLNEGSSGLLLVLIFLLSPLFFAFFEPLLSYLSRRNEFSADEFSSTLQNKEALISALGKLGSENSSFPLSHKIYSFVYHSHPSLYERIERLKSEN